MPHVEDVKRLIATQIYSEAIVTSSRLASDYIMSKGRK